MVTLSVVIPATDRRATLDRVVEAVKRAAAGPGANGDVLVFLDADVEVHDDVFTRIRAAFDNDASLTAVFGSYDDDPVAGMTTLRVTIRSV